MKTIVGGTPQARARTYTRYLMASFNKAKVCDKFEVKRVYRAFGLAMKQVISGEFPVYHTTFKTCSCDDFRLNRKWNKGYCKHMISKMIVTRAEQAMEVAHTEKLNEEKARKLAVQAKHVEAAEKRHQEALEIALNTDYSKLEKWEYSI